MKSETMENPCTEHPVHCARKPVRVENPLCLCQPQVFNTPRLSLPRLACAFHDPLALHCSLRAAFRGSRVEPRGKSVDEPHRVRFNVEIRW